MKSKNIPSRMLYTREQLNNVSNEEVLFIKDGVLISYNYRYSFDDDEELIEVDSFVANPLLVDELFVEFNFYWQGQLVFLLIMNMQKVLQVLQNIKQGLMKPITNGNEENYSNREYFRFEELLNWVNRKKCLKFY
jgi:hypothetical protein